MLASPLPPMASVRPPNTIPARCLAPLLLGIAPTAGAQAPDAAELDRVQVTATRVARPLDRTPAAMTVVAGDALRTDTAGTALAETLAGVPGVLARTRQNYAQDEQVSIRGFGTRATFGIRSVRVFVDGLPATSPDGQGQVAQVPLAGLARIEVLRGPFAALYGNGAGGVVQAFTRDGGAPGQLGMELVGGSFDTWRLSTGSAGALGDWAYSTSSTYLRTDGYRAHSRTRRDGLHAKASRTLGSGRLTLVLNGFDAPDVEDPQGLTAAQAAADPRQASAAALAFDTRKSTRQLQLGAIWTQPLADGELRLLAYGGERRIEQVLGTPVAAQASPLSAGGWIDLRSPSAGVDARWTWQGRMRGRPVDVVAGLDVQAQRQDRRGYENFTGTALGVRGRLRQQQDDDVRSVEPYVQAHWDASDAWTLAAGLRASRVRFRSRDRYVTAGNPDDSGGVDYRGTSPVLGATWRAAPGVSLHAAYGHGFETPTFNELAYRADGGSGPNFRLRPMRSRNAELGLRLDRAGLRGELTAFRATTRDELAVGSSSGGRTVFRNAGDARRQGVEAAVRADLGGAWQARIAVTWLDATYRTPFPACAGPGCATPAAVVAPGTRIPGVPRTQAHLVLRRGGALGWHVQGEAQHVGGVSADTAGAARASGYTLLNASAGYGFETRRWRGRVFGGVTNLGDRRHVGSVIVNEANGRAFEPGAGRAVNVGIALDYLD
ncbi:TonB-dependent receptor family protein [Lysobacter humi (ex Lee et al. 2017)]